jgi:cellulose biosynthesis protein BcsQ
LKTLALYNIKGGVGKTTTAVNLAWIAAREGRRTLLWDLDPQGAATFTFRVKPKVKGGGKELLDDQDALAAAIKGTDFRGLDLVPADFSYRNLDRVLDRGGDPLGRLRAALEPLQSEYDCIFLDCPASISLLSENVFTAADALLVPTIPTVLSLRTLARLMKHLKERKDRRPLVLPFFSMVDRRKRLHREVCDYAEAEGLGFLRREIPYASVIEQMGVRRNPLGAYALASAPSKSCLELWREIGERLEAEGRRGPSGKAMRSLLHAAEGATRERRDARRVGLASADEALAPAPAPSMPPAFSATPSSPSSPSTRVAFRLRVRDEADFERVVRVVRESGASNRPERTAIQESHFFDTASGALRGAGGVLRLRIEGSERLLGARGPARRTELGLVERPEAEVQIAPAEAERLLSDTGAPLELLAERLGDPRPSLIDSMSASVGDAPLLHLGSFRNVRRSLGPIALGAVGSAEVTLEMDRTELPGGRLDHELEVQVAPEDADECRTVLEALLERARIPWVEVPDKAQSFFAALAGGARVRK